ncbi:MAG: ATP-binding protein [Thermodesulfovibrionales bacterium]
MEFIDRERELESLKKFWQKKEAQLIVIYGKRRVGKTELIKQFIKDKPHIYFLAQKINEYENLKLLGEAVGEYFDDDILKRKGFESWKWFFEYLKKNIKKQMVLVIDEFPYLAEVNKGISSVFQSGWDEYLKDTPLFLILCGSSISMMEEEVLSYKAPLYGRRTGQIFLKPFSFLEAKRFYPNVSFERCLELYSIAGGNPSYLKRFNPKIPFDINLKENVLQPEAFLYNEVEFILREELREPRNYFAILKAIALNKNKVSEIVNETGLPKGILHKYLFILEDLHIIQKEVPVTEKNPLKSRKGIYKLQDQFFKFWFKYILPNKGNIEEGKVDFVLKKIKGDLHLLLAENYEKVAQEIIRDYEDRFFPIIKIGRWWDRKEEIDIVALNEEENKILFGEVKWSSKPVGTDIYYNLKEKARKVESKSDKRYEYFCLFSKSGFTEDMIKVAKKEKVVLFHKDEMVKI